ncbi:MAG: STAS domain-containing protein [Verrucomicrobiales bacterium]
MSLNPSIFADTETGPEVRIRVEGKGTFQCSPALRDFSRKMIEEGRREFIIDLKDCPAMDSTFMGTLAGIATRIRDAGGGDLWVVNRNERNSELLAGLGIDAMFSDKPLPAAPNGVKAEPLDHTADKAATREAMHEAHTVCIAVNPENAEKFKDVLETLKASATKAGKS